MGEDEIASSLQNRVVMKLQRIAKWALGIALTLCLAAAPLSAQTPSPNSYATRSDVVIRVRLRTEEPPPLPVSVQLCTQDGISIAQAFTHGDARADFRDIKEGRYRIRVEAAGYLTYLSEAFDILHNEHSHNEVAYIDPAPEVRERSAGTISADDLNIPEKARSQLEKGAKAFSTGKVEDAIQAIRKAIEIFPRYAQAYNNLGVALTSKGDHTAAGQAFAESIKINERFTPPRINVARLRLKTQDLQGAADSIQKVLELEPKNLEGLAVAAQVQFFQGRFEYALSNISRIHAVPHEEFADVHLIAAEVYQKRGDNAMALQECRTFLAEAPKSPRVPQVRKAMAVIEARK